MRQIARGVKTATSRYWQTNSGIVEADGAAIVIDAGVLPDELRALAAELEGCRLVAGISTHEHWDHVLWSRELGADVPRFTSQRAKQDADAGRLRLMAQVAQEESSWNAEWEHDLLGRLREHPFGVLDIAGPRVELVDLAGHSPGHIGVWVDEVGVAFVGDTTSDIDPPSLSEQPDSVPQYLATIDRLSGLVESASVVVPGHGRACDPAEAMHRLDLDRRYLDVVVPAVAKADARWNPEVLSRHTADLVADPRLDSSTGWMLHAQNITDLLSLRAE